MAEDKKGFILYADQKELFEQLSDDVAGQLIKHIFNYVNDENPTSSNPLINLAFTPIKQQFKRDLVKWTKTKKMKSEAGKAGAKARWQTMADDGTRILPMAEMAVNVKVNDTVNVKDNVKDKDIYNTNVFLKNVEYNDLVKKIGKDQTDSYISKLSKYMLSTGKEYMSHYNTILLWLDKDNVVDSQKPFKIPE